MVRGWDLPPAASADPEIRGAPMVVPEDQGSADQGIGVRTGPTEVPVCRTSLVDRVPVGPVALVEAPAVRAVLVAVPGESSVAIDMQPIIRGWPERNSFRERSWRKLRAEMIRMVRLRRAAEVVTHFSVHFVGDPQHDLLGQSLGAKTVQDARPHAPYGIPWASDWPVRRKIAAR